MLCCCFWSITEAETEAQYCEVFSLSLLKIQHIFKVYKDKVNENDYQI